MLPLIQPVVDLFGIAMIGLLLAITAIAAAAITIRAIGLVTLE